MTGRISGAILGGLMLSIAVTMMLSVFLPVASGNRLLFAGMLQPLMWVAAMAYGFLAEEGLQAWLGFLGASVLVLTFTALEWMA